MDDDNSNIISRGQVVVTNDKYYQDLVASLRQIKNYTYVHTLVSGYHKDQIIYTLNGAIKYESSRCPNGNNVYTTSYYRNPNATALRLITGNLYTDSDGLLDLFITLGTFGYKEANCLSEFEAARKLVEYFDSSLLDSEMVKKILKRTWSSFGYYAIDGLACTDIEVVEQYDKDDSYIKRLEFDCQELAKRNSKVLTLAKKVHNITKK